MITLYKCLINNRFSDILIFFVSILVFFYAQYGYINNDGIGYLAQVDLIKNRNLNIFDYNGWPFYSLLIYHISSIFNISSYNAAQLVNLFSISLIFFLIRDIIYNKRINNNFKIRTNYLLILLFFSSPISNYFFMTIRDNLFILCMLLVFYFLYQYLNNHKKFYLCCSFIFIIPAFLMRYEAIVYGMLVLCLSYLNFKNVNLNSYNFLKNCKKIVNLKILLILSFSFLIFFSFFYLSFDRIDILTGTFLNKTTLVSTNNLSDFISNNYYLVLLASSIFIAFFNLIKSFGYIHFIVLVSGGLKKYIRNNLLLTRLILFFVIANLCLCVIWSLFTFVDTPRYFYFSSILFLIFLLKKLESIKFSNKVKFLLFIILCLFIRTFYNNFSLNHEQKISNYLLSNKYENILIESPKIYFYMYGEVPDIYNPDFDVDNYSYALLKKTNISNVAKYNLKNYSIIDDQIFNNSKYILLKIL